MMINRHDNWHVQLFGGMIEQFDLYMFRMMGKHLKLVNCGAKRLLKLEK